MIKLLNTVLKKYLVFLFLSLSIVSIGQDAGAEDKKEDNIYSIPGVSRNQLESVLNGNDEIISIIPFIEQLFLLDPQTGNQVVNELLLNEKTKKYSKEWAMLLYFKTLGELEMYSVNEELEILKENAKECIVYFEDNRDPFWLAKCLSLLSDIHFNLSFNNEDSLYIAAFDANKRALNLMLENQHNIDQSYSILGEIYRVRGNICLQKSGCSMEMTLSDYDLGLEYFTLNADRSGQSKILLNKAIAFSSVELDYLTGPKEDPIYYFEKSIDVSDQSLDRLNARLEYSKHLHNKFLKSQNKIWNRQSNIQLQFILNSIGTRKSEAYFQLAVNTQSYLSYTAAKLTEEEQDEVLDSVVYYYKMTLEACKKENNLKGYNDIFDRLSIACPYFSTSDCQALLFKANEVKSHFMEVNKRVNEEITQRNEDFRRAIESQRRRELGLGFIIALLGVLCIFFFLFYRQKIRNLKTTDAIKEEALRAQMNPHFISNTINAIESLVNQGLNNKASEYLIVFSRLCRLVINHSRDAHISLKEELDTLGYFLSLEQLRLSDDLEFHISVDTRLNKELLQVPPLILQPFIENAIWHGIKYKKEPKHGKLNIEINQLSDDSIECIIEDNGVGRAKAAELQKASVIDQKSWGTTLTQERINFLNKDKNASLEIIDLFDSNDKPRGTRVRILLPIYKKI